MKYKIGDKVWANFDRPDLHIVGELPGVVFGPNTYCNGDEFPYLVNVPGYDNGVLKDTWSFSEASLRPRDDPEEYDGNRAGDWAGIESLKPNSLKPNKVIKEAA